MAVSTIVPGGRIFLRFSRYLTAETTLCFPDV